MSALRKIARGMAKRNMKRSGLAKICKDGKRKNKSFFAENWRTWVNVKKGKR